MISSVVPWVFQTEWPEFWAFLTGAPMYPPLPFSTDFISWLGAHDIVMVPPQDVVGGTTPEEKCRGSQGSARRGCSGVLQGFGIGVALRC